MYNYAGVDLAAGQTQDFTLTNYLGCDSVVTVSVSALTVSASSLSVKTCPGTTYNYAGVDLAAGQTQDFTLTNYLGCDSVVTVSVSALPVSASNLSVKTCPGTTYNYAGVDLGVGQTQDFTLTNYLGCDSVVTVTVFEKKTSAEFQEVKVCPGEVYNFNGTDIAPGETREYHLFGWEGCDSTVTITVTAWPALDFEVLAQSACPGSPTGSLSISVMGGGSPPTGFALNGTDFQAGTQFDALAAGDYTVSVQDVNGCIFEKSISIDASPRLEVSLPEAFVIPCESNTIQLVPEVSGDVNGLQFNWWNGKQTSAVEVSEAGPVWVEVSNHCETVRRESSVNWPTLADGQELFYVPNIFAPDAADEENRTFRSFITSGVELLEYRMEVYDRWGNFMFGSELPDDGWEGLFHKKMMDPGVYAWILKARVHFCGRVLDIRRSGDVTVLR